MRRWTIGLGFLVSAVFLYLSLRGLHLGQVWRGIQGATYGWIIPGVLIYFVGVWARTWRWHYMLRPLRAISPSHLFPVVAIGYMGNNIYPARAGEVVRAYALRRKEGMSMSTSLATIFVERILDGLVMLLFILVTLPLVPLPPWLRSIVIVASPLFLGALILFLALAARPRRAQAAASWVFARLSTLPGGLASTSVRETGENIMARFLEGLSFLRGGRELSLIFGMSLLIWLVETATYWCVMQGFNFRVPFHVLMLMNGVVNLATILPSSPGYVGTFDAPGIRLLEGTGVPRDIAAGYTLVLHATLWLPITLLGLYYMGKESISWRDLSTAGERAL